MALNDVKYFLSSDAVSSNRLHESNQQANADIILHNSYWTRSSKKTYDEANEWRLDDEISVEVEKDEDEERVWREWQCMLDRCLGLDAQRRYSFEQILVVSSNKRGEGPLDRLFRNYNCNKLPSVLLLVFGERAASCRLLRLRLRQARRQAQGDGGKLDQARRLSKKV